MKDMAVLLYLSSLGCLVAIACVAVAAPLELVEKYIGYLLGLGFVFLVAFLAIVFHFNP